MEAALNAEMTHHLGYDKNQPRTSSNARNGYSTKMVASSGGPLELQTPRDRDGTFEPQMVKKNQTRITGMDNLLSLITVHFASNGVYLTGIAVHVSRIILNALIFRHYCKDLAMVNYATV